MSKLGTGGGVCTDYEIRALKKQFNIIEPFDDDSVQPTSYDLHFDASKGYIKPPLAFDVEEKEKGSGLNIPPSTLTLVSTKERIFIPKGLVGVVYGKSSLARIGLVVHQTGSYVDTGFHGDITMELVNHNEYPIRLYDGCPIGQLVLFTTTGIPTNVYNEMDNHYQHQKYATASRYEETFDGVSYHIKD